MVAPALAATTATVEITATPSYISIAMGANSTTYDYGSVVVNSLNNTTAGLLYVENDSSIDTDITIGTNSTEFEGGLGWHISATATQGNHTAGLKASHGTGNYTTLVYNAGAQMLYNTCPAATDFTYELQLLAPNEYTDGVQKKAWVTITAVAHP
jgi:hypothetical protein